MTSEHSGSILCILGCGKLGTAILRNLARPSSPHDGTIPFTEYIACVRSEKSQRALTEAFSQQPGSQVKVYRDSIKAVTESNVIILAADPADVEGILTQPDLAKALEGKLLISVAAGWTRQKLETTLPTGSQNVSVVRTLPNIAALVGEGLTAIEVEPDRSPPLPDAHLELTRAIFNRVGETVDVTPGRMDAATAVGGSTPAFFAVICDALIDAAVAVGVPRDSAKTMVVQSMKGSAAMMQSGLSTGDLRDQGTSPEGCTIGGLMVLEEGAVRGHVGRALREAVTVARLMETVKHVNDTRRE